MKNWFTNVREWMSRQINRFKRWFYGLLVAVGLISGGLLYAETVSFTYTRATLYDDGTIMPLSEIQSTRLYCNGSLLTEEPGADQSIDGDLGIGTHECYATHVDIYDRESLPSGSVTRVVSPPGTGPSPPVLEQ